MGVRMRASKVLAAGVLLVSGIAWASVAPTVGKELYVAQHHAAAPAISSNGHLYLVVWADDSGADVDIFAARVRADDFTLLDTAPIRVSRASADQDRPSVSSDGTNFFVVWSDRRNADPSKSHPRIDLYGAHVRASDGKVLEPEGIALNAPVSRGDCEAMIGGLAPSITSAGDRYLVTFLSDDDCTSNPGVYDLLVTHGGATLGTAQQIAAYATVGPPVASSNGDNFLVAWPTETSLDTRIVEQNGSMGAHDSMPSGAYSVADVAAARDGADYRVVFSCQYECPASYGTGGVYTLTVNGGSGAQSAPEELERIDSNPPKVATRAMGGVQLVAWTYSPGTGAGKNLHGVRYEHGGARLDSKPLEILPGVEDPALSAALGNGIAVARRGDALVGVGLDFGGGSTGGGTGGTGGGGDGSDGDGGTGGGDGGGSVIANVPGPVGYPAAGHATHEGTGSNCDVGDVSFSPLASLATLSALLGAWRLRRRARAGR